MPAIVENIKLHDFTFNVLETQENDYNTLMYEMERC